MAMSDALDLERTATEVAVAAARFAAAERNVNAVQREDVSKLAAAEQARCVETRGGRSPDVGGA